MCGITGIIIQPRRSIEELRFTAQAMAEGLTHRGPDDAGTWANARVGIAFGQRRLSIMDLSAAGHQPMISSSGRYVLAFNGEIYNHVDLRNALISGGTVPQWRGQSDTETLLACIENWGVARTLIELTGMFAFAIWDSHDQRLILARDRIGEKPLYYGWTGRTGARAFVFGSELKALRAYSEFNSVVCREALSHYVRFNYVPAPFSIYQNIFKLEPGCFLIIDGAPPFDPPAQPLRADEGYNSIKVQRWWSLGDYVKSRPAISILDDEECVQLLEDSLSTAVRSQLVSDVPLGAFLSGGIDSSTVVALMQSESNKQVKTFTIGFDVADFDETSYARAVAGYLGTDHYEMYVTAKMVQKLIPSLPWVYDEPFADSSQIPTHFVCSLARQHVTVALSGDGADELFGGYTRYLWGRRVWNRLESLPLALRQFLSHAIMAIPIGGWDYGSRIAGVAHLGDKVHRLAGRLRSVKSMDDLYWNLVSEWDPASVVKGIGQVSPLPWESNDALPAGLNAVERMMFCDTVTYLPDDILCKVDRAAMACSLETRVPYLDHRVMELAWRLPFNMKIRGNMGKWALRQVLYKYVPKELIERPKAGFAIPVGQWLRGPLRDWAESLLGESRIHQEGYFHPEPIRKAWAEHLAGRHDHTPKIWTILMFQAWLEDQNRPHTQKTAL